MVPPAHLARLRALHPAAEVLPGAEGTTIAVPGVGLPAGWNASTTTVRWVVQVAYPASQPDCFYADSALRLANGAMPSSSGIQSLNGQQLLWFSWHLIHWDPRHDDLVAYLRFIESRFTRAD